MFLILIEMKKLLWLLFVTIVLLSCQKSENFAVATSTNTSTILSCSGVEMSVFTTKNQFIDFINSIVDLDIDDLHNVPILNNFMSEKNFIDGLDLLSDSDLLIATDNGSIGTENYELLEPLLSLIVNKFHEIRIEGINYEINNDFVFAYLDCSNKATIDSFKSNPDHYISNFPENAFINLTDSILVFKTHIDIFETIDLVIDEESSISRGYQTERVDYDGGRRKLKGKIYHSKWGVWVSLGVSTVNYRKRAGIWFRTEADQMRLSWDIDITGDYDLNLNCREDQICSGLCPEPVLNWSGNEVKSNRSSLRALFDW